MKLKTAMNAERRFRSMVAEHFRMAKTFHLSHKDLSGLFRDEVLKDPQWNRCPGWVRSYILGYRDALFESYWQNVKWVFPWKGELYDKFNELPEEARKYYLEDGKRRTGFHVYKDEPKCFFTGDHPYYQNGMEAE